MKNKKIPLLFIFFSVVFFSCDPNMVYDQFQKTDENLWSWDEKKVFEVDMEEPEEFYNIFINVRHTKDYPKRNLYVFLTIEGPNETEAQDTIDIAIADPKGRWLGSGFGDIKFVRKQIRKNVRFSFPGTYTFTFEQGMRIEEVPVTDVGLRIEYFKKIN